MTIKNLLLLLTTALVLSAGAQKPVLTLEQQFEDLEIFKGGLQEGHSGLYFYIDKTTFEEKCDSIKKTFLQNASIESYYLKLRYLITLLRHGHTRVKFTS